MAQMKIAPVALSLICLVAFLDGTSPVKDSSHGNQPRRQRHKAEISKTHDVVRMNHYKEELESSRFTPSQKSQHNHKRDITRLHDNLKVSLFPSDLPKRDDRKFRWLENSDNDKEVTQNMPNDKFASQEVRSFVLKKRNSQSRRIYRSGKSNGRKSVEHPGADRYLDLPNPTSIKSTGFEGRRNYFRCQPCNCSVSERNHIHAHCRKERLTQIPSTLPAQTWSLDMTQNNIAILNISSLSQYHRLTKLTLKKCSLTRVFYNSSMHLVDFKLQDVDLSHNHVSEIDDRSFELMRSLQNLTLRGNALKLIRNETFAGLSKLVQLDLSHNNIHAIHVGAFDMLTSLKSLNLSHNVRFSYTTLHMPPRLFSNLVSLVALYIQGNSAGSTRYPCTTLATLKSLKVLVIDGLHHPANLGPEFKLLKKLRRIEFGANGGNCYLTDITENYFENTPFIDYIGFENCPLKEIHPRAFKKISHLEALSLKYGKKTYNIHQAFDYLIGLQNSTIKSITFNHLIQDKKPCVFLTGKEAIYLQHLNMLEELDLSSNMISVLYDDFSTRLPRTLKKLVLTNNILSTTPLILNRLFFLTQLKEIDIGNQNLDRRPHKIPGAHFDSQLFCPQYKITSEPETPEKWQRPRRPLDDQSFSGVVEQEINHTYDSFSEGTTSTAIDVRKFSLPPQLRILKAPRYTNFAIDLFLIDIQTKYALAEIDLSRSFMPNWGYGKMMKTIVTADLSENYCKHISRDFFQFNNSLRRLIISNNFLGPDFAEDFYGDIFRHAKNLNHLNVQTNLIYHLPQKFFHGLDDLRFIDISNNKIQNLNTSFSNNKHLEYIDASKNSISWISRETRNDLDKLATYHPVYLDLTMNPLPCTCEGVEIVEWMATTNVTLLNSDYLKCRLSDSTVEDIGALSERLQQLQRKCKSKNVVIIVCTTCIAVFLSFLCMSIAYRYRWRFLYLQNVALSRLFGRKHTKRSTGAEYVYDAFVIHADTKITFVKEELETHLTKERGHKLCIPDDNFMPGSVLAADIVAAVRCSKVCLVICTSDLVHDPWATYSIKMALSEEHFHDRRTLLLLLVPDERDNTNDSDNDVDEEEDYEDQNDLFEEKAFANGFNSDLLYVKQRGSYIEYPLHSSPGVSESVMHAFWDNLSQTIGFTSNRENPAYIQN